MLELDGTIQGIGQEEEELGVGDDDDDDDDDDVMITHTVSDGMKAMTSFLELSNPRQFSLAPFDKVRV